MLHGPRHHILQVKLGFLLAGGIYLTDLLHLEPAGAAAAGAAAAPPPAPQVRGLAASNLSVSAEGGPGQQQRLVLRFWAEREGPFEASFGLELGPGQEVRRRGGVAGWGAAA